MSEDSARSRRRRKSDSVANGSHVQQKQAEREDVDMTDGNQQNSNGELLVAPENAPTGEEEDGKVVDIDKISVVQSTADGKAASFQILNEDHTLGNALRYVIMKNPAVQFCGYSIPHPSEPKMNIRIQVWEEEEGVTAADALMKGLGDLVDICDVVEGKFAQAMRERA